VTWESSGDHAAVQQRVLAILNPRRTPDRIKQFVEDSYTSHRLGLGEQLSVAANPRNNAYRAKFGDIGGVPWHGEVTCGHNPWLRARKVKGLHVVCDSEGAERLEWVEIARPQVTIAKR
jgi:hypothetical protein